MIVNAQENGWEIIFQRNHALLAGAIACEIHPDFRPPHWVETLSAIIEHDDGQTDWSEHPHISDTGRPIDFTMYEFDIEQAKRVINEAKYKSQWITLLVSMHVTSLYTPVASKSAELRQLLKDQVQLQKQLLKTFSLKEEEMNTYYRFLRWCDECSLILCQNRLTNKMQKIEIGSLHGKKTNFIQRTKEDTVQVAPWCFTSGSFKVSAEVYKINQLTFASSQELKKMIEGVQPEIRYWEFQKPPVL